MGLFSFQVELGARGSAQKTPTPVMALSTQVYADLWHRRLSRMNSRSVELLRKKDDRGVDFTGTLSDCDICHINKSQQKAHPTKSVHDTSLFTPTSWGPSSQQQREAMCTSARLPTTSPG